MTGIPEIYRLRINNARRIRDVAMSRALAMANARTDLAALKRRNARAERRYWKLAGKCREYMEHQSIRGERQGLYVGLYGATRSGHMGGLVMRGHHVVAECPDSVAHAVLLAKDLNELVDIRAHGETRITCNELRHLIVTMRSIAQDFAREDDQSPFRGVTARDARACIKRFADRMLELVGEEDA